MPPLESKCWYKHFYHANGASLGPYTGLKLCGPRTGHLVPDRPGPVLQDGAKPGAEESKPPCEGEQIFLRS